MERSAIYFGDHTYAPSEDPRAVVEPPVLKVAPDVVAPDVVAPDVVAPGDLRGSSGGSP
jgi:hypothetical protein